MRSIERNAAVMVHLDVCRGLSGHVDTESCNLTAWIAALRSVECIINSHVQPQLRKLIPTELPKYMSKFNAFRCHFIVRLRL